MRRENEWFKPEKLKAYMFVYDAVAILAVLAGAGVLYWLGAFADAPIWVVGGGAAVVVATLAFVTWWIPAFYRTAQYRLGDDEIEYHRGVFFRQKTDVPYNRITNVGTTQGPVQRLVGAGSVAVHTAGYGGQMGAELTVSGVGDFEDIKEQVLDRVRRRPPVATESGDLEEPAVEVRALGGEGTDEMIVELRRIRELLEEESSRSVPRDR